MRVLLVGEGQHERGKEDRDGALETLVRRLHQSITQCDLDRVSRKDIHAHHGKGQGYFKKALRWIREAEKRGYNAIVLVIDQDNAPERVQEITKAQNDQLIALRRALGVALRTFDAWMLADEQALTRVLGYPVSPQRSPEDVSDAKGVCTQLLGKSAMAMSQSEFYAFVAREADLSTLERQCSNPRSRGEDGVGMIVGGRTVDSLKTWLSAMRLPGLDQQGAAAWRLLAAADVLWLPSP